MAGSLQDQLLKQGLVSKKKAQNIKRQKHHNNKLKNKSGIQTIDENKLAAEQEKIAKAEKDRQLNAQRKAQAEEKAITAQVKQLISINQLTPEAKDVAFIFTYQGKSESLVVSRQQQEQLNKGRITIVAFEQSGSDELFTMVPEKVAEKIKARRPEAVAFQADLQAVSEEQEDPYAAYEIPDDLMW